MRLDYVNKKGQSNSEKIKKKTWIQIHMMIIKIYKRKKCISLEEWSLISWRKKSLNLKIWNLQNLNFNLEDNLKNYLLLPKERTSKFYENDNLNVNNKSKYLVSKFQSFNHRKRRKAKLSQRESTEKVI